MMTEGEEKGDMGPFEGMDPALVEAISRYGTPPYRELVRVEVRDVGSYEFDDMPTTIEGWIDWLTRAREDTPERYRATLQCVLEYERGHYDSGDSASLRVWYDRPETDEEMTERVVSGIDYVRGSEAAERRQYEALKAKFEGGR